MSSSRCFARFAFALGPLLAAAPAVAAPQLPASPELARIDGWRAELLSPAWREDKTVKVNAAGERSTFGALACLAGSEPKTLVQVEPGKDGQPAEHGILRYRGPTARCVPQGVGVIAYADGSQWLGEVGAVESLAVPNGLGELTQPDGLRYVMQVRQAGLAWQMARGLVVYHPEQDWYAQGEFADGWKTEAGVYRWNDGREFRGALVDALPAGRGRYTTPGGGTIEGEIVQEPGGLRWRGTVTIELPFASGFGPAGQYLVDPGPDAKLGAQLTPVRWAPSAALLAAGVANDRGCPVPPAVPSGWVPWWPGCAFDAASGELHIPVYAPDLGFALTYTVKDNQLARSMLEQRRAPAAPLTVVARWEALMFDPQKGLQPLGEGARMLDPAGTLAYQGPFLGLEPDGKGFCGRPAAEGGGVEVCEWQSGKRVDEAFKQRAERLTSETEQRKFEERLAAEREAQEGAAREAAERARQAAEEQRKKSAGFLGFKSLFGLDKKPASAAAVAVAPPPVPPPALPPAAATEATAGGALAALKQQKLEHACASGYKFSIDVPYRTAACLAAKLDYTRVQVCNEDDRLVAAQQACQAACGQPNCVE